MQSVQTILAAVASGETTPIEQARRSADAIDASDGELRAFAAKPTREALETAAKRAKGPLAGICVGVKDIYDTHDLPTEYGTPIHAGHRPASDCAIVAMLRAKGGLVAGKTATTEFAFLSPTVTRNPHNPAHTPGGSSSGSAAAVAAGMVPVATGTQTGGSVVRPASYCGVAGYKPSFRLVPLVGVKAFSWSLDTAGFFAAGVADVAEFTARLTGRDLVARPVEPGSLRVGLYRTRIWNEAEAPMREAVERTARLAEAAGATLVEIEEADALAFARDAHGTLQNFEAAMALAYEYENHRDRMSPILRKTLEDGRSITPHSYDDARRTARRARRETGALFEKVDVLLTPAATGAAPRGLESTGSPVFNKLWTLTGNPCISVPGFEDALGLPLGIQILTRFGSDTLALSVGAWLEGLIRDAVSKSSR